MKLVVIFTRDGLNPSDYEIEDFYEMLLQTFKMSWTGDTSIIHKRISSQLLLHRIRVGIARQEIDFKKIEVKVDNEDGTFTEADFNEKGDTMNMHFWQAGNGIFDKEINLIGELFEMKAKAK